MAHDLFLAARAAMAKAYAPYSKFPVGAALRTADGRVFAGANIEVASYPEGWCAETTALGHYIMAGGGEITEIAVIAERMARVTPVRRLPPAAGRIRPAGDEAVSLRRNRRRGNGDHGRNAALRFRRRHPEMTDSHQTFWSRNSPAWRRTRRSFSAPGLGPLASEVENPVRIAYADLPGFPQSGVTGHAGEVVAGMFAGTPGADACRPRPLLRARRRRGHASGAGSAWRGSASVS